MNRIVLLDFDGVISPFPVDHDPPDPWGDLTESTAPFTPYSPRLIETLLTLPAELVWLTTRETQVLDIAEELGFPPLRCLPKRGSNGWYKEDWALETANGAETVVWFDDDASNKRTCPAPSNLLSLSPNRHEGLTPHHLETASRFLRRHPSRPAPTV